MEGIRAVKVDDVARARPEYWSQETIGEANGSLFKAAKGIGSTMWHAHDDEDEVFLVTQGTLVVEFRGGDVVAREGELLVIPRGVEHRPRADDDEVRFLIVGTSVTSNAAGGKPEWSVGGGAPTLSDR